MNKIVIFLLLFLTACANVQNIDDGMIEKLDDYQFKSSYQSKKSSEIHNQFKASRIDMDVIGKNLISLSKKYFNPSDYQISDQELVDYDSLILTTNDNLGLLAYKSSDNPYGLNPEKDQEIEISDQLKLKGIVILSDIYELSFNKRSKNNNDIDALSYALVFNSKVYDELGIERTIAKKNFDIIVKETVNKFKNYLDNYLYINNIPILINIYINNSDDSMLPGHYSYQYYFDKNNIREQEIENSYSFLDSSNNNLYSLYQEFKTNLNYDSNLRVDGIAYVLSLNNQIYELKIEISTISKNYLDQLYLIERIKKLIYLFTNLDHRVLIKINDNYQTIALLEKEINEHQFNIIYI